MVSGEEGMRLQAIGPDVVARGKEIIPSPISLKRIDYENKCFEIEAMLTIRLYQRFFTFFVTSFDYDALITKSYFCPNPVMWDIF